LQSTVPQHMPSHMLIEHHSVSENERAEQFSSGGYQSDARLEHVQPPYN